MSRKRLFCFCLHRIDTEEYGRVYSLSCEAARLYKESRGEKFKLPPVSGNGHFYIPFTAKQGGYYDGVSIASLIKNEIPSDYWAGKIVLIGPYAAAFQDQYFTPIDKGIQMYGVEIHANLIQCMLDGKYKTEVPALPQALVLYAICAAATMFFLKKKVLLGAGVCAGVVIADVSGKGIPAALFMMVTSSLIHHVAVSSAETDPAKVLRKVNAEICLRNPEEMFITVWLGILELSTGKLTAASAGHEYPVLKKAGENFELFKDRHGLVIGAMEDVKYRSYELQLQPGSKLFVYTDGIAEATNIRNELFGTERLVEVLQAHSDAAPTEILHEVDAAVGRFVGEAPQFDDMTMLCIEYRG